jgi:hypothetical protein
MMCVNDGSTAQANPFQHHHPGDAHSGVSSASQAGSPDNLVDARIFDGHIFVVATL